MDYARLLERAGLKVRRGSTHDEHRPGTFAPIGVMWHHTASRKGSGDVASLPTIEDGRPGIPGPLVQILIGRKGTIVVTANGRANHAGRGSSVVLREAKRGLAPKGSARARDLADDTDGNTFWIGIEFENDGRGEPFTGEQYEAGIRVTVVLDRALGLHPNATIGHGEWTARKYDPAAVTMAKVRATVAQRLKPPYVWRNYHKDGTPIPRDWPTLRRALPALEKVATAEGAATVKKVRR